MQRGEKVAIGDMPEGTWFWFTDGDLTLVTGREEDKAGNVTTMYTSYWPRNHYSRGAFDPDMDAFPDLDTDLGRDLTFRAEHGDMSTVVEVCVWGIPPVTDDEVAAALASIKAAIK